MPPRRLLAGFGALALLALITVGLVQLGGTSGTGGSSGLQAITPAQMRAALAGSPPALTALHTQADRLLGGGQTALRARLASLHGTPVVINKWASWCPPCRSEFAVFQHASVNLGRRVAFIGIDSRESSRSDALAFLRAHPVSYPSYYDQNGQIGEAITDSSVMPVTVFYDRTGGFQIIQGPFLSLAKLEADIERYAVGS